VCALCQRRVCDKSSGATNDCCRLLSIDEMETDKRAAAGEERRA
jgi:hypothetical protein